jgi:hypothetical protein
MIGSLRNPLALALLLALAACQQSAPPATTSAPAKPAAAPLATTDSVGVPECDDYLNKYQACVENRVPEAARGTLKLSIDQTRAVWRLAAANPGGKEGLATACKQARDASKTAMAAYGCTDL